MTASLARTVRRICPVVTGCWLVQKLLAINDGTVDGVDVAVIVSRRGAGFGGLAIVSACGAARAVNLNLLGAVVFADVSVKLPWAIAAELGLQALENVIVSCCFHRGAISFIPSEEHMAQHPLGITTKLRAVPFFNYTFIFAAGIMFPFGLLTAPDDKRM